MVLFLAEFRLQQSSTFDPNTETNLTQNLLSDMKVLMVAGWLISKSCSQRGYKSSISDQRFMTGRKKLYQMVNGWLPMPIIELNFEKM